jgi:hypothetical protein
MRDNLQCLPVPPNSNHTGGQIHDRAL